MILKRPNFRWRVDSHSLRQRVFFALAGILLIAVGVLYLLGRGKVESSRTGLGSPLPQGEQTRLETVRLYFGAKDQVALVPEVRTVVSEGTLEQRLQICVRELARGSFGGHTPVLPPETRLRRAFLDPWGVAYLDFDRGILGRRAPGDGEEWLAVASIVRTLCENYPEVRRIRFLVDGHVVTSLGGYVDLEEPLEAQDFPSEATVG